MAMILRNPYTGESEYLKAYESPLDRDRLRFNVYIARE